MIEKTMPPPSEDTFYCVSGPRPMCKLVRTIATLLGYNRDYCFRF